MNDRLTFKKRSRKILETCGVVPGVVTDLLMEVARVDRFGGYVVFDGCPARVLGLSAARDGNRSVGRFPVRTAWRFAANCCGHQGSNHDDRYREDPVLQEWEV